MKVHSTNYQDTFIKVADDCPALRGEVPPLKGAAKTVAGLQFDLVRQNPYRFTSDEVLFRIYAERQDVPESERTAAREQFFPKGQPCFRASPLTKRYGWGVHSNQDGKIAIYGRETPEYECLAQDSSLQVLKAMRTSK